MQTSEHDVIIAGGGPTGLMLAGELALAGVSRADCERQRKRAPDVIFGTPRCGRKANSGEDWRARRESARHSDLLPFGAREASRIARLAVITC
jgi:glycine/D-amino acid oxidase-like deaminating enzyme